MRSLFRRTDSPSVTCHLSPVPRSPSPCTQLTAVSSQTPFVICRPKTVQVFSATGLRLPGTAAEVLCRPPGPGNGKQDRGKGWARAKRARWDRRPARAEAALCGQRSSGSRRAYAAGGVPSMSAGCRARRRRSVALSRSSYGTHAGSVRFVRHDLRGPRRLEGSPCESSFALGVAGKAPVLRRVRRCRSARRLVPDPMRDVQWSGSGVRRSGQLSSCLYSGRRLMARDVVTTPRRRGVSAKKRESPGAGHSISACPFMGRATVSTGGRIPEEDVENSAVRGQSLRRGECWPACDRPEGWSDMRFTSVCPRRSAGSVVLLLAWIGSARGS